MHPLKKYFNEGLIQVAIFLSLAGMHVHLDLYLPHSHNIHCQSSTQAQVHSHKLQKFPNGYNIKPKNSDFDECVPTPRMLQSLHSLEHLHIPATQIEAWLVHSQTENSRITIPNIHETQEGNNGIEDSDGLAIRMGGGGTEATENNMVVDESLHTMASLFRSHLDNESISEEWIPQGHHRLLNEEDGLDSWQHSNPFYNQIDTLIRADPQYTEENTLSREDYIQLSETSFPVQDERPMADLESEGFIENPLQCRTPYLSPLLPQHEPLIDLEQQWQDVMAIMGPQDMGITESMNELGSMENTTEDSIGFHQTTQIRGSQTPLMNFTNNEDTSYRSTQNHSNLNFNDSDIRDFLLSSETDTYIYDQHTLPSLSFEELNLQDFVHPLLAEGMFDDNRSEPTLMEQIGQSQEAQKEEKNHADSDSGLSLDFSRSAASPTGSEYSCSSSSCSSSISSIESFLEEGAIGYSDIKEELTDEEGAVGYCSEQNKLCNTNYLEPVHFHHLPSLEPIGHDHTYNQPFYTTQRKKLTHSKESLKINMQDRLSSRDEKRARAMKIPFSTDYIINLPVERFNELFAKYHLTEAQLALIRDIRRRGKNKVAAQNCRRKKLDILLDLRHSVDDLRRHRARLLREKNEILHSVKEMKQRLNNLDQQVWSRRRVMEEIHCSSSDANKHLGNEQHISHSKQKSDKKQKDKQ